MCEWWITHHPRQIGGLGEVVEIDEALIARRKNNRCKIISIHVTQHNISRSCKSIFHKGRVIQQRWVFGAYSPASREGFIVLVPDRKAITLLPLIRHHIAPGSIIYSDEWKAYNREDT